MKQIVIRYPLLVRINGVFVSAALAIAVAKGSTSLGRILIAVAAFLGMVVVLAHKTEVDTQEVRVRHFPFWTTHVPLSEIRRVEEGRTLTVIAPHSRIPLWGLSREARDTLLQVLRSQLNITCYRPKPRNDATRVIRGYVSRAVLAGVGFLLMAAAVVPFLAGFPLHVYWDTAGKYVLVLCMAWYLFFIFEAGFAYAVWRTKADLDSGEGKNN
ncbi:MAG: hypothetical protein ACR2IF_04955 [Terriglobales bacterium]